MPIHDDEARILGIVQLAVLRAIQRTENASRSTIKRRMCRYHAVDGSGVYVCMQRLEKRGLLSASDSIGKGGRPVKLYKITEEGERAVEVAEKLLTIYEQEKVNAEPKKNDKTNQCRPNKAL